MKKVVLLAPYFLPRRRVGAWRPFKFAIHLREFGWDPHVITIHEKTGSLTDKEAQLLSDIPVYELTPPFDLTHKLSRHLDLNGQSNTKESEKAQKAKDGFNQALNWIDHIFPIDTWLPLFIVLQQKIKRIVHQIDPEILWSTGDPWSSHWMAMKVAKNDRLPWVADFRDPWTLSDIQLQQRSGLASRIDGSQEKKIIREASALTFTAQQTERLYSREYPEASGKSTTIYNCFDSDLFNQPVDGKQVFSEDTLNLLFFGKFRPLSPAKPFILLLEQIKKYHPGIATKIRMYSFGSLSWQDSALAKEKGLSDNFISLKPIALENALSILAKADLLWLSTHPSRDRIIPAKLWDYLAAKRPVVSIAPNPEIQSILEQTGSGHQFDLNSQSLIEFLCKSATDKAGGRSIPVSASLEYETIKQYDADRTTRKLAGLFDQLL